MIGSPIVNSTQQKGTIVKSYMLARIAKELGLPSTLAPDKIIKEIKYLKQLVWRLSLPGLREQVPNKYNSDTRHIQDLPR